MSRIAVLAFREFEDAEVEWPVAHFQEAGHDVVVVGPSENTELRGREGSARLTPDAALADAAPESFDALVLPGDASPKRLRRNDQAVDFVRRFWTTGRPVAAIEEGIELLRVAGVLQGVQVTSAPAFRHHLQDAGARWVDRNLVVDGALITARNRTQLDAFCAALEARIAGATEPTDPGGGSGDDPLSGALTEAETALVTPIVPGEAESWAAEVRRTLDAAGRRFRERSRDQHAEALRHIRETDPALLHRVRRLEEESEALRGDWTRVCEGAGALARQARAASPDEAAASESIEAFRREAIDLVLRTRQQAAAVRTWMLEAFHRDRGVGD